MRIRCTKDTLKVVMKSQSANEVICSRRARRRPAKRSVLSKTCSKLIGSQRTTKFQREPASLTSEDC